MKDKLIKGRNEILRKAKWIAIGLAIGNMLLWQVLSKAIGLEGPIILHLSASVIIFFATGMLYKTIPYVYRNSFKTKIVGFFVIVFCFYTAFAVVGNYLFLYPVGKQIGLGQLVLYLLAVICFSPVCLLLIRGVDWLAIRMPHKRTGITKQGGLQVFIFSTLIVMLIAVLYIFAFNPAITTYDSLLQAQQAKGLVPLSNWQTPFHTLFIRGVFLLWDSPTMVVLIQALFFALVWASGIKFLYHQGLPLVFCLLSTAVFFMAPNNALHLATMWKDIPYTASLLWLTILLAKLLVAPEKYLAEKWYLGQWVLALVFTCLLRQNGIVPFILTAAAILLYTRLNKKILMVLGAVFLSIVVFYGPVFSLLEISRETGGGKYIGFGQDMVGVYQAGGELTPEAEEMVLVLMNVDETRQNPWGTQYLPYYASLTYDLNVGMVEFLSAYISTFIQNPIVMTQAILNRMDPGWNIFFAKDGFIECVNLSASMDWHQDWLELYPARTPNIATLLLTKWNNLFVSPTISWLFWRVGIYTWMIAGLSLVLWSQKKQKFCLALVPWFGQFLSLYLSSGWADYRYFWPLGVCGVFFAMAVMMKKIPSGEDRKVVGEKL